MRLGLGVSIARLQRREFVAPDPVAPVNIVEPSIEGEPFVDSLLNCNRGQWSGVPAPTFAYQWQRDNVNISGATAQQYTLQPADAGAFVSCVVTATNSVDDVAAETPTIGPVLDQATLPFNEELPTISGTALTGSLLTAVQGLWTADPEPTFTYQWNRDGSPITSATDQTYSLTSSDTGHVISVTETATNTAGSASATSADTATVTEPDPPYAPFLVATPVVTGTAVVGGTLTSTQGVWDSNPAETISFQWTADGFDIFGETGNTYTIRAEDRYKVIRARVTATNTEGSTSATTAGTALVTTGQAELKRYIRRLSAGNADGSSWENAGSLSSLSAFIQAVGPNGRILLRADEGSYTAGVVTITQSGALGQNVLIHGVDIDEQPRAAVILGTRTSPWVSGGSAGQEVFRLMDGVHHLTFRNIEFQRCGNGCFRFAGAVDGVRIEQCTARNVQRFIENTVSGIATVAPVTNLTVKLCNAYGFGRAFLRLRYAGNNALIEDCHGDSEQQDGENFASGVVFSDTFNTSIIRRVTMINPYDSAGGNQLDYWNGDCFSQENGNFAMQYIDCLAKGATDGGFDCKGDCTFLRCVSSECKRNWRLWGTATLTDCVSRDAFIRGGNSEPSLMSLHSADPVVTLNNMAFVDTREETVIFRLDESTAILTINSGSLQRHPDSTLVMNLGPAPFDASNLVDPPEATVAPALSGTETAGSTLSVTAGTWDQTVTISYQWCRDGLYIDGATSNSYLLKAADVDHFISCRVFAVNETGHIGEAVSDDTSYIAALVPSNVVLPSITGVPSTGATLTANPGSWNGLPAPNFTYQWERDTGGGPSNIGGATNATYVLGSADLGAEITVTVTATNAAGSDSERSAATTTVGSGISVLHVGPVALGTRDGTSFANAISLGGLAAAFNTLAPGGEVKIRADAGTYNQTVSINLFHGGTAGNPITIRGCDVDGDPMRPLIVGTRTNWVLPANPEQATSVSSWSVGNDIFRLNAGADHLLFQHLSFRNVGKCFNLNIADVDDITAEDIEFYNVQDAFYTNNFDATNITLKRWKGTGYSKRAIRIYADCHDWLVEDFEFNSGRQDRDDFAGGIICNDTAHDIVVRGRVEDEDGNNIGTYSGIVENHHDTLGGYWNGDSIGTERGNYNILWENIICRGNTDGGIDTKGIDVTMRKVECYDNKKNFRLWGFSGMHLIDCISRDPRKRGGSSGPSHVHIIGPSNHPGAEQIDLLVEGMTFDRSDSSFPSAVWTMLDQNIYNTILRNVGNTFLGGTIDNNLPGNSLNLRGSPGDNIDPVITIADTSIDLFNKQGLLLALTANEDVFWTKMSGDAELVVVDSGGVAAPTGRFLELPNTTYVSGGDNTYSAVLRAEDALGNTADVTVTVNVLEGAAPETFHAVFEGTDLQTTPVTDSAGGKTISLLSGARLTATEPLEGTTSLLLSGSSQRAETGDHDDFNFGNGDFGIIAKIKPTTLIGTFRTIVSQWQASSDQRAFRFGVTPEGALQFIYTSNGDQQQPSAQSANGLIVINTQYEVAVDRGDTDVIRLYIDGVMVASVAAGSNVIFNSNQSLKIGNHDSNSNPFIGRIDDVRIWKGYAFANSDAGYTPENANFDFATDGFAVPFWPNAGPTGVYSSRTGTLWMVEEGSYVNAAANLTRRFHVRTRDMATSEISPICFVGDVPTYADYHGPAAICELPAPATGHFIIVGGDHDGGGSTGFKAWVTETVDEPAGWRPLSDIGSERTYAKLAKNDDTVVLFSSHSELGVSFRSLGYQASTSIAADGTITWGSLIAITNPTNGRSYAGPPVFNPANSDEVHFTWLLGNLDDSQRVHVYYGILDLTDGSIKNFARSVSTASGSLPMNDALMDASYRIFTQDEVGGANTCIPVLHFDAAGNIHIAWSDGEEPTLTAKHSIWDGDSWVTTNVGTMAGRYDQATVSDGPAGGVLFTWQPTVSGKKACHGKVRSAAGVWGDTIVIWETDRDQAISGAVPIIPPHANAAMAVHETPVDPVNVAEDGTLKSRVIKGDGAFLPWIRTGYNFVNDEADAYNARRIVSLAAVHEDLPYYVDRLFTAIKDIGLSKFESYYVLGLSALDNTDPREDLLHAGRQLIKVGAPPFTPYHGFDGNGSTMRLDSPINLDTSTIYTRNSAHIGSVTLSGTGGPSIGAIGSSHHAYIVNTDGVNMGARINSASGTISFANTLGARASVLCRSGASALALSTEGVQRSTASTASTGVPNGVPMRINNANSAGAYGDYLVFMAHWGANLTAAEIRHLYFAGQLPLRRLLASAA